MATDKRKVVVVGAGMAGLSAASELSRSGLCDVIVLEAMGTPGGRIQTIKGFASNVIELGAHWMHGTEGNPVYELASKHNLLADDSSSSSSSSSSSGESGDENTSFSTWFNDGNDPENRYQTEDGQRVSPKVVAWAKRLYAKVLSTRLGIDPYDMDADSSLGDFLRKGFTQELEQRGIIKGPEDLLRQYWLVFEHCCRMECVDIGLPSLEDVQLRSYTLYEEMEGDYYSLLGAEGYSGVLDKLLQDIPAANVHYNTPVERIEYSNKITTEGSSSGGGNISVKCEDGRTFCCNHVIVTSSVGFLKENVDTFFDPPLPSEKREALMKFQYGTVDKIFLRYDKPFWSSDEFGVQTMWQPATSSESRRPDEDDVDEEGNDDEERGKFYRMFTGVEADDRNSDVLVCWVYGRGAEDMETMDDAIIGQRCARILRRFLNDPSIPDPDAVLCTRWHSNKYQLGSYGASLALKAVGNEYDIMKTPVYDRTVGNGEEEKVPLLLFAGEAFDRAHYSTTHGAMICGRDQAKVILKFLSLATPETK